MKEVKGLKILVIDDKAENRELAVKQLSEGNDLTVVGSYDEGLNLVYVTKKFVPVPHSFDMVLTDLMMPASNRRLGDRGQMFVGKEMGVGVFLALIAARQGAKYVGLLSDQNHHDHPLAACLDEVVPMEINGAKVIMWSGAKNWKMLAETLLNHEEE